MIERELLESHLRLSYREDMGILFMRWTKQVNSEQLRKGYLDALAFAEELNVHLWLIDLRGRGGATPEDEAWILDEFFLEAEGRLGHKSYIGYLLSPAHFTHVRDNVGLEKLNAFSSNTTINVFTSESGAVNWLSNLHEVEVLPKRK
ncbi:MULTISPECIES: hypothetical protein [Rufibacter]|uniref:STAS/SEC14 domain-containing protein n=1 Tax=Rufibacter quisquiliarum TaxID=1549639 RepID=A0A839GUQ7_9BACT|nr:MULTISPECIES: hypothetical protein [Rufibacter]MBA9078506.1 hypothetical protein [Rufibacter quisquiliarum]